MRVSPIGFAFNDEATVLKEAEKSAIVTHNHPEGIKGAQATALAIYLARTGSSKTDMRAALTDRYGYDLDRRLDDIRPAYHFDISCQGTVPAAFIAFYESIARDILKQVRNRLPDEFLAVINRFNNEFDINIRTGNDIIQSLSF